MKRSRGVAAQNRSQSGYDLEAIASDVLRFEDVDFSTPRGDCTVRMYRFAELWIFPCSITNRKVKSLFSDLKYFRDHNIHNSLPGFSGYLFCQYYHAPTAILSCRKCRYSVIQHYPKPLPFDALLKSPDRSESNVSF